MYSEHRLAVMSVSGLSVLLRTLCVIVCLRQTHDAGV